MLLEISFLSKSTYYFILAKEDKDNKNIDIMNKIREIYNDHHGRYGYRRITLELKNNGVVVNHKKIKRLMCVMGLYGIKRKKRKYNSYQGFIGRIADNKINRNFTAFNFCEKWFTDITEFNLRGERLYLSPIIDAYNQEIIAYTTSKSPSFEQVKIMMDKALVKNPSVSGVILHSNQGWQYQYKHFQRILSDNGIIQSMSRKGNSLDNGLIENFFALLKCEMFYDKEHTFASLDDLSIAIDNYIEYYNNKRIKVKLKGLSPIQYRLHSLYVA